MSTAPIEVRDEYLQQNAILDAKQNVVTVTQAVIVDEQGNQTGSGSPWFDEDNRLVWYMPMGGTRPSWVKCTRISPDNVGLGLGVILGYVVGSSILEVISEDPFLRQTTTNTLQTSYTSPRAADFGINGRLQLWLEPRLWMPLAVYPVNDSLRVNVREGWYIYNNVRTFFAGYRNINLGPSVPTTVGHHRYVGIYLNSSNTVGVVNGTSVVTSSTPPEPTWPSGALRLVVVKLTYQQAVINLGNHIFWRRAWDFFGGASGGWKLDNLKTVSATNTNADFTTIQDAIDSIAAGQSITVLLEPNYSFVENLTIDSRNVSIVALGGNQKAEASVVSQIDGTITVSGATNNWEVSLINIRVTGLITAGASATTGVFYMEKVQSKHVTNQRLSVTGNVYTTLMGCDIQRTGGGTAIAFDVNAGAYAQKLFHSPVIGVITVGANTNVHVDGPSVGPSTGFTITSGGTITGMGGALAGSIWLSKANGSRIKFGNFADAHTAAVTGVNDVIEVFDGEYRIQAFNFNKVLTVRGSGMYNAILYNEDGTSSIQSSVNGVKFENITFSSRNDEPNSFIMNAGTTFKNCRFITNSATSPQICLQQATTTDCYLYQCIIDPSASPAATIYGIGITSNGGCNIFGGTIDGFTASLYGTTGIYNLRNMPLLLNSTLAMAGTINGQWSTSLGELRSHDNILTVSGTDLYPGGDEAGVKARNVDLGFTNITDHFDGSFTGWTWASYAGFGTPDNISMVNVNSHVQIYNNGGTAATRYFGYRAMNNATESSALCRCYVTLEVRAGIRIDDGSNSNYVEFFLEAQGFGAPACLMRMRYAVAGVVTGPTTLITFPMAQELMLQIEDQGASAVLFAATNFMGRAAIAAPPLAFTKTRAGIYIETTTTNGGTDRAGVFDWYKQQ